MDYEKKYKEANDKVAVRFGTNVAKEIFTDLYESEDEKIRKKLIIFFQRFPYTNLYDANLNVKNVLAWLEKQGEKKVSYTTLVETGNGGINALVTKELPTNGCNEQKPFDYENATIVQKDFAPKTEPKFHKEEWLCENEPNNYARFIQILETVNVQGKERYRISRDIHNDEDIVEFDFVEKYYHKFDIRDAKPGDVLYCESSGIEFIIILKQINNRSLDSYCRYNTIDGFAIDVPRVMSIQDNPKPATKEQRDLLFQKMKEAGYEWDAIKKRTKKIEQKSIDNVEPKFNEGDTMRTLKEANDGYTDGMPVVVSVDSKYYHCNNETIPIADQEDYEYPPMNKNQKTTDNVGPKFKVGDWIVNNVSKDIFLIRSVNSGYCSLEDTKGNIYVPCLPFESDFHLWTIQDAKDGDVLICGVDEKPFIFKGLLDPNYPNCPVAYCGIGPEGYFYVSLGNRWTGAKDSVYPATKKQRDLLFEKMKEAEYEWDSEKKELSKRVIDEGKSEN